MGASASLDKTASRQRLWMDLAVLAGLIGLIAGVAYWFGSLVVPFFVSAFLAYLLSPTVDALQRRGFSRFMAAGTLYSLFALMVLTVVLLLMPQVRTLQKKLPEYAADAKVTLMALEEQLQDSIPELRQYHVAETATAHASAYLDLQLKQFPTLLFHFFALLSIFVLIPIITWYFLLEGLQMKKALISLVPNRYFETVLHIIYRVDQQLSSYLAGQLVDALIVGLLSVIGYTIIGVRYSVMIGTLSGFANLIPFVGPISGAAAAVVVTILEEGLTAKLAYIIGVATVIQVIDGHLIQPTVLSKSVNLHPLTIITILLVGGELFGLWGMILGIPAFCITKIFFQELSGVVRRHGFDTTSV